MPEDFGWLAAVPWALTALGIVTSLAWNYFNYRRTSALQRRLQRVTIRLDEFRLIRAPIDAVVSDFRTELEVLASLAKSEAGLAGWRTRVGKAERRVTSLYARLEGQLQRANASAFASGDDWLAVVESLWDRFNADINGAYNPNRGAAEARVAVARAAERLGEMVAVVEARIDREVERYTRD